MEFKDFLPTSFSIGPPLPMFLGIRWPWVKAKATVVMTVVAPVVAPVVAFIPAPVVAPAPVTPVEPFIPAAPDEPVRTVTPTVMPVVPVAPAQPTPTVVVPVVAPVPAFIPAPVVAPAVAPVTEPVTVQAPELPNVAIYSGDMSWAGLPIIYLQGQVQPNGVRIADGMGIPSNQPIYLSPIWINWSAHAVTGHVKLKVTYPDGHQIELQAYQGQDMTIPGATVVGGPGVVYPRFGPFTSNQPGTYTIVAELYVQGYLASSTTFKLVAGQVYTLTVNIAQEIKSQGMDVLADPPGPVYEAGKVVTLTPIFYPLRCPRGDAFFNDYSALAEHFIANHPPMEVFQYVSGEIGMSLKVGHLMYPNPIQCPVDAKTFDTYLDLANHISTYHQGFDWSPYITPMGGNMPYCQTRLVLYWFLYGWSGVDTPWKQQQAYVVMTGDRTVRPQFEQTWSE